MQASLFTLSSRAAVSKLSLDELDASTACGSWGSVGESWPWACLAFDEGTLVRAERLVLFGKVDFARFEGDLGILT